MRMSDWSSDVWSSDLFSGCDKSAPSGPKSRDFGLTISDPVRILGSNNCSQRQLRGEIKYRRRGGRVVFRRTHTADRKSVVEGKSGTVRGDLEGRRIINKKKTSKIVQLYIKNL